MAAKKLASLETELSDGVSGSASGFESFGSSVCTCLSARAL